MVQPLALRGGYVVVDRPAHDRVGEPNHPARLDNPCRDQSDHRRIHVGARESGQSTGVTHLSTVSQDAEGARKRGRRRRQPRHAQQHRIGDATRDDRADILRGGGGRSEPPSRCLVQQLREQERIAASHLHARLDEPRVRRSRQLGGDQRAHGRPRQRRRPQKLRSGIGEQHCRLGGENGVKWPGRQDQRDRQPLKPASDERQRARRRRIAPLQIVDHQHQRRIGRNIGSEPIEAVLPPVARIVLGHAPRRTARRRDGSPREQVRRQRRRTTKPALTLPTVGLHEQALEQLEHHPVREPLLELRRAGPQNPEPETRRPRACLLQQSRLPHPGRTLDHQGHPGALPHSSQRSADALDLLLTLEQAAG